jgi:DNA-binding NarL/FixJ family response regulator
VIKVLLVDDQPLVRAGLRRILRPREGFDIAGECDDGDQVIDAVAACRPDVVIMDIRMKRVDGATATRELSRTAEPPPVLVLTTFDDDETLSAALRAGATGFVLKDAPGEEVIRSVRVVADGGAWLDPAVTARVLRTFRSRAAPQPLDLTTLTTREQDVLRLMARGATNSEIAAELFVSEATVKSHVGHIFTKLGLRDRAAAIVFAFDHGLVTPER